MRQQRGEEKEKKKSENEKLCNGSNIIGWQVSRLEQCPTFLPPKNTINILSLTFLDRYSPTINIYSQYNIMYWLAIIPNFHTSDVDACHINRRNMFSYSNFCCSHSRRCLVRRETHEIRDFRRSFEQWRKSQFWHKPQLILLRFYGLFYARATTENFVQTISRSSAVLQVEQVRNWGYGKVQGKVNVPSRVESVSSLFTADELLLAFLLSGGFTVCVSCHRSTISGERAENFYDHINNCSIDALSLAGKLALVSYFFILSIVRLANFQPTN